MQHLLPKILQPSHVLQKLPNYQRMFPVSSPRSLVRDAITSPSQSTAPTLTEQSWSLQEKSWPDYLPSVQTFPKLRSNTVSQLSLINRIWQRVIVYKRSFTLLDNTVFFIFFLNTSSQFQISYIWLVSFWPTDVLMALLLVAHWLERWCASLLAQVRILADSLESAITRVKNPSAAATHHN